MELTRNLSCLFGFFLIASCAGFCPRYWSSFQGSCYEFIYNPSSWVDADVICKDRESYLVEIGSVAENNFLKTFIRTNGSSATFVWTGGNDLTSESLWMWEASQSSFTITDWSPGEPNNVNNAENCMEMAKTVSYRWNDRACSEQRPFICEKEASGRAVVG